MRVLVVEAIVECTPHVQLDCSVDLHRIPTLQVSSLLSTHTARTYLGPTQISPPAPGNGETPLTMPVVNTGYSMIRLFPALAAQHGAMSCHISHCLDASPTIIQAPRRTSLRPDVGQETLLFSAGGLATVATLHGLQTMDGSFAHCSLQLGPRRNPKHLPHREKRHKHGWEAWGDCIAAPRRPRLDRGPSNQSTHGPPAATFEGLEGVSDSEKYVMPLTD
jgi:hypothetical protein